MQTLDNRKETIYIDKLYTEVPGNLEAETGR